MDLPSNQERWERDCKRSNRGKGYWRGSAPTNRACRGRWWHCIGGSCARSSSSSLVPPPRDARRRSSPRPDPEGAAACKMLERTRKAVCSLDAGQRLVSAVNRDPMLQIDTLGLTHTESVRSPVDGRDRDRVSSIRQWCNQLKLPPTETCTTIQPFSFR